MKIIVLPLFPLLCFIFLLYLCLLFLKQQCWPKTPSKVKGEIPRGVWGLRKSLPSRGGSWNESWRKTCPTGGERVGGSGLDLRGLDKCLFSSLISVEGCRRFEMPCCRIRSPHRGAMDAFWAEEWRENRTHGADGDWGAWEGLEMEWDFCLDFLFRGFFLTCCVLWMLYNMRCA